MRRRRPGARYRGLHSGRAPEAAVAGKEGILAFVTTRVDPQDMLQSEVSRAATGRCCPVSFLGETEEKWT